MCVYSGFVDQDLLFATARQEVKSQVVESQITLFFWPWLSLTEKQQTVSALNSQNKTSNPINIFNDSISKFYQC